MTATKTKPADHEAQAQQLLIEAETHVKDLERQLADARTDHRIALARVQGFQWQRQGAAQAAAEAERQAAHAEAAKLAKREKLAPLDMQIKRFEAELPTHQESGNVAGVEALKKLIADTKQRRTALAATI